MAANLTPKSVREYIGARYVPVFSNPIEWSNTREYEPLTIVTHQGNSYTSMQYVPTGIDIDNTAFWALTGNYNAQIEQYRREVQEFDGRITENAQDIQSMENTVNALTPNYMVVIGDSYSSYDYNPENTAWHTLVGQQLNCIVKNYAKTSAGYTVSGNSFSMQVQNAVSDASFSNSNVKYVFVYGGRNDTTITNESVAGIIASLKSSFTHAQIIIIGVNTWVSYTSNDDARTNVINVECSKAGVTFMNSLWMLQTRASLFGSNAHPNANGNAYEAYWILSHMNGLNADQFYQDRPVFTVKNGDTVLTTTGNIIYQQNSGMTRLIASISFNQLSAAANLTITTPNFYMGGLLSNSFPVIGGSAGTLGYISGFTATSCTVHLPANSNGINFAIMS